MPNIAIAARRALSIKYGELNNISRTRVFEILRTSRFLRRHVKTSCDEARLMSIMDEAESRRQCKSDKAAKWTQIIEVVISARLGRKLEVPHIHWTVIVASIDAVCRR